MISKSLSYNQDRIPPIEEMVSGQASFLLNMVGKVRRLLLSSELEKSQADYRIKQQRESVHLSQPGSFYTLSVGDKQRLGLHRFMD